MNEIGATRKPAVNSRDTVDRSIRWDPRPDSLHVVPAPIRRECRLPPTAVIHDSDDGERADAGDRERLRSNIEAARPPSKRTDKPFFAGTIDAEAAYALGHLLRVSSDALPVE